MNLTRISKAQVTLRFDKNKVGTFVATVDAENNKPLPINYVSPYGSNSEGAFIAIPEVGVEILVCQPEGSSSWYYLGSTFAHSSNKKEGETREGSKKTPIERVIDIYERSGFPMKQVFLSKKNAGLIMHEDYNKTLQNIKTVLKSTTRKTISLIDTPALDSIVIDSGNKSRITLTDTPLAGLFGPPAQAILLESNGPQRLSCQESSIDISVNDGKDISITNGSTGLNAGPGSQQFGNINLQSDTGDINLFTTKGPTPVALNGPRTATDGRIFLQCLNPNGINQVIQLETRGIGGQCVIRLISSGKIELTSLRDIDIISGGNINMVATGNINTQTLVGSTNIRSTGNINADAATINLNSGASTPPIPIPTIPPISESYYPITGILTPTNGLSPI